MAYMVNRDAPYSGLANLMAMNGRFGDTELVHMSKPEIRGLSSLGELTINPDTGLPEAFSLKAALPIIGGIAGSMLLPGVGTALGTSMFTGIGGGMLASGLGSFAGGLLAGQPFGQAALGGLMAGATSGIAGAFGGGGEAGQAAGSGVANTGSTPVATGTSAPSVIDSMLSTPPPHIIQSHGVDTLAGIHGGELDGGALVGQSSSPPQSNLQSWLGANKNKLLLGGAGLAAAGLAGDEGGGEVAPSPPITPLTQYTFNRERREGAPRTEEELRRQATQGGNYSFFEPGAFDPIARANEGGLVSLANQQPAQQRSNVTNFMFSDNPQDQNVFDEMFKVGEAMSQPQQQPNTGLMQLAVGGQPKSNIAQMLNPTLRQQVPSLPPFNYDTLRRRASIGQEESPVDIFQTQHEEILRDALGRIVEDSSKEVIETPEEPVAPIAPIPKPVNVFSDDGDPDTAGMSGDDIAGPGVAAAMGMADTEAEAGAAEAAAASDAEAAADAAEIAEGGLIGLANGGSPRPKAKPIMQLVDRLTKFLMSKEGFEGETRIPTEGDVPTIGFGHTGKYAKPGAKMTKEKAKEVLSEDIEVRLVELRNKIQGFNALPLDLQIALAGEYFRGSVGQSPDTIDLINEGEYGQASEEFLDNDEYRDAEARGRPGIRPRMELVSDELVKYQDYLNQSPNQDSIQAPVSVPEERDMGEYSLRGEGIQDILARLQSTPRSRMANRAGGGPINQYFEGQVIGKGDGQSDQILFEVEGKNPDMALLSRDEYVLPADAVSMLGNGSSNAGAKELDQFVKSLRQQSFGTQRQQQRVNPQRGLSALV